MGCCVPVLQDADNYYTKEEVDDLIDDIVISGDSITSGEVQTMIDESVSGKADSSAVTEEISAAVSGKVDSSKAVTGYILTQWYSDAKQLYLKYNVGGATTNTALLAEGSGTTLTQKQGFYRVNVDTNTIQEKLVSGTNIKTINNQSILGSGNINIEGGGSSVTVDPSLSTSSDNPVANSAITNAINTVSAVTSSLNDTTSNLTVRIQQVRNEVQDNYLLKNKIWCGSQSEWASISGNPQSDVLYLIHE